MKNNILDHLKNKKLPYNISKSLVHQCIKESSSFLAEHPFDEQLPTQQRVYQLENYLDCQFVNHTTEAHLFTAVPKTPIQYTKIKMSPKHPIAQ